MYCRVEELNCCRWRLVCVAHHDTNHAAWLVKVLIVHIWIEQLLNLAGTLHKQVTLTGNFFLLSLFVSHNKAHQIFRQLHRWTTLNADAFWRCQGRCNGNCGTGSLCGMGKSNARGFWTGPIRAWKLAAWGKSFLVLERISNPKSSWRRAQHALSKTLGCRATLHLLWSV